MTFVLRVDWTEPGPPVLAGCNFANRGRALRWLCKFDEPGIITHQEFPSTTVFRWKRHAQIVFNPTNWRSAADA